MPQTDVDVPEYVFALKELPGNKGVIDMAAERPPLALYYQTVHGKPLAEGYIARVPADVARRNARIMLLLQNNQFESLYRFYHFQYLVTERNIETTPQTPVKQVFDDGRIRIYDLGAIWQ
jgi:hypothetical protein